MTKERMEGILALCQMIAEWCELVAWKQHHQAQLPPETKLAFARERDEMVVELFRRVGLNYEQFGVFTR